MPALATAGLLGAILGSFLNVVIHRLPRGESLSRPRSRCGSCGTQIAAYDNVPLLSWLALRGRCRHCEEPISARYPGVELATAVAFVAVVLVRGLDSDLLLELPFVVLLIAVAGIDLEHRIVPNKLLLPATVWALGVGGLVRPDFLLESVIAGAAAFTFLLLTALAYPAGMGMGDVKLAGVMGLYLGIAGIPALLIGFLAGSLVGVGMLVREGAKARKKGVPFAPFLALGGIVALLAGNELVELYADRFL